MKEIKQVISYYESGIERTRLLNGASQIEYLRTKEIISAHLSAGKKIIADIGGGTGIYSFWLNELGHEVHFLDLTPGNVADAKKYNDSLAEKLASINVGNACALPYADNTFDVVLLLGPMYHLIDAGDRNTALKESFRVLKKGGIIFVAIISKFASLFDGFFSDLVQDPAFVPIMQQDLQSGTHINNTNNEYYFTSAYFHKPGEIKNELENTGYTNVTTYAADGFGWLIPGITDKIKDENYKELLLDCLRKTATEPSLLGVSAHHITIGFKHR